MVIASILFFLCVVIFQLGKQANRGRRDASLGWWRWIRLGSEPIFATRVALVGATTFKNRKAIPVGATTSKNRNAVRTGYITAGCNIAGSSCLFMDS